MCESSSFDHLYSGPSLNSTLVALLPEELRTPPLDELDCNGFLTIDQLAGLQTTLAMLLDGVTPQRRRLVDFGCGSGGLLRYLAARLHCCASGIDISSAAISLARAATEGEATVIDFRLSDFAETDIDDGSVAAIISLDALYLASNPRAALTEARRVLIPGGALVFTTYVTPGVRGISPSVWGAIARSVGFEVVQSQDCTHRWRDLMRRKHESRLASRKILYDVLGDRATAELQVSEAMVGWQRAAFIDATERHEITFQVPGEGCELSEFRSP